MKHAGAQSAQIDCADPVKPEAMDFGDSHRNQIDAYAQAERVFLRGSQLPPRWRGRQRFVILEVGFGMGCNFLATWDAWQSDPARCERLHYLVIAKHPPSLGDLMRAHATAPLPGLSSQLVAAWPPLTQNLHRVSFEQGRVELLLAFGDLSGWLRELVARVDAFHLDGLAAPHSPDMWSPDFFRALPRLAAPDATATTWSVERWVQDGLARHGFVVAAGAGAQPRQEMTVARFAPRHQPPTPAAVQAAMPEVRDALIIGAGLAGAATASALAAQGWVCSVLDGAATPAAGASGNPAGLFGGSLQRHDGSHARFIRAAALAAQAVYRPLMDAGHIAGNAQGMLRLLDDAAPMRDLLEGLQMPASHARLISPTASRELAGLPNLPSALQFEGGGWLAPVQLVRFWLNRPGVSFVGASPVASLRFEAQQWVARDADGHVLAAAAVAVIANASAAARLAPAALWRLSDSRGQITLVPGSTPALAAPRLPLANDGYALTLGDGDVLCGATSSPDDLEPALRDVDHRQNLRTLARLTGRMPELPLEHLGGRVSWRCRSVDRLPIVGAVPVGVAQLPAGRRVVHARDVARQPGLFVLTALGARGITYAPLCAQVLAAWVTGAPQPLQASLLNAIDAARFVARAARRP